MTPPLSIVAADTDGRRRDARVLILEYAASLPVGFEFQAFAHELASLDTMYGPPLGRLLVAYRAATPAGCVALRPLDDDTSEMKRLYVRPACRDQGIGRALAVAVIEPRARSAIDGCGSIRFPP
jgi:GNAT superfamily N-acetyltransferase